MMENDCAPGDEIFTQDMRNRLDDARPLPEDATIPERTPLLEVSLSADNGVQRAQAAQLTHSWQTVLPNGDGSGYVADAVHPLQIQDYSHVTLTLVGDGKIALRWDDYPPRSVTVRRWNAIYESTADISVWDDSERIAFDGTGFAIADDGNDYIYEVYAKWPEGDSYYAFRVESAQKKLMRE
jgi:hypothetical protein